MIFTYLTTFYLKMSPNNQTFLRNTYFQYPKDAIQSFKRFNEIRSKCVLVIENTRLLLRRALERGSRRRQPPLPGTTEAAAVRGRRRTKE